MLTSSSVTTHKQWRLRVEVESSSTIVIEISTEDDATSVLKSCHTPDRALAHIDAALAPFERGDSVAVILLAPGEPSTSCFVPNKHIALNWLGGRLVEFWDRARKHMGTGPQATVTSKSGVVAAVRSETVPPASGDGSSGTL